MAARRRRKSSRRRHHVGTAAGAAKARAKKAAKRAKLGWGTPRKYKTDKGPKKICQTACRRADGAFKKCR